jgi:hypothetical protein
LGHQADFQQMLIEFCLGEFLFLRDRLGTLIFDDKCTSGQTAQRLVASVVIGDKPLPTFDPNRLNRFEQYAWVAVRAQCGPRGIEELFDSIVSWSAKLTGKGSSAAKIREIIIGSFYDDVVLMRLGQSIRNRTITLAKVMVEQAIEALCL